MPSMLPVYPGPASPDTPSADGRGSRPHSSSAVSGRRVTIPANPSSSTTELYHSNEDPRAAPGRPETGRHCVRMTPFTYHLTVLPSRPRASFVFRMPCSRPFVDHAVAPSECAFNNRRASDGASSLSVATEDVMIAAAVGSAGIWPNILRATSKTPAAPWPCIVLGHGRRRNSRVAAAAEFRHDRS